MCQDDTNQAARKLCTKVWRVICFFILSLSRFRSLLGVFVARLVLHNESRSTSARSSSLLRSKLMKPLVLLFLSKSNCVMLGFYKKKTSRAKCVFFTLLPDNKFNENILCFTFQ